VVAVADASFSVDAGEVFGLLGPNGAGKTTTLHLLATLARPTAGRATVCGFDVVRHGYEVRRRLGYLSATSGLPAKLTTRECLRTFARLHRVIDVAGAVANAVERFDLGAVADRYVEQLSTGMRQRARIACAAVHDPPVLILDEPTAGLDVVATDDLLRRIVAMRRSGAAVVFSTHVLGEAERVCDRVAIVAEGRIRAIGAPAAIAADVGAASLEAAFLRLVGR
jgi:sodium transport system ATP-binding protein